MGLVRYEVTRNRLCANGYYQSGAKKGQPKNCTMKAVFDHYEYGIEDSNGDETATLGHRFATISEAMSFYAWYFHGAEMTDEVRRWLEQTNYREQDSEQGHRKWAEMGMLVVEEVEHDL